MTLAEVLQQARTLSQGQQKELIKSLIELLAADAQPRQRRLSELRGAGKEIWQDIDAQTYVDRMRDEWDPAR